MRAIARLALLLLVIGLAPVVFGGCLSRITAITAPTDVAIDTPFMLAIDGSITGSGGGIVAIVLQVPDGFEVLDSASYYVCASAHRPLRRNRRIATRFRAEDDHSVVVFGDSIASSRVATTDIRAFIALRPTRLGTYTFAFATGAVFEQGGQPVWKCTDPEDLRDFSRADHTLRRVSITVTEPERTAGAAVEFGGTRSYVALPDSQFFRFDLTRDFTIETLFNTTAREGAIVSTRIDDLTGGFPFELGINAWGAVELATSGGDSVLSTTNTAFFADGRWHHVAVVYTASTRMFELYVDALFTGRLIAPARVPATVAATLGSRPSKRHYFVGALDEFRIWTEARTQEQISYYRTIGLTGYEQGLHAMYTFDKGEDGRIPNGTPVEGLEAVAYNRPRLIPSTAPLKVELLAFNVSVEGETVSLSWDAYDESTVKYYEIEKRSEATKYVRHQLVEPLTQEQRGQGHQYTDTWNGKSLVYYRLRKVSTDGSLRFSDEVPVGSDVVLDFTLGDNQPNPFATETVISYTLTERAFVSLVVYNMVGQQVVELVGERQPPGTYAQTFTAGDDLPAGMYFYKMRTAAGAVTKKMYLAR